MPVCLVDDSILIVACVCRLDKDCGCGCVGAQGGGLQGLCFLR